MRNKFFSACLLAAMLLAGTMTVSAQAEKAAPGDQAWEEVEKAKKFPAPPAEWQQKRPAMEELTKFRNQHRELVGIAADKSRDFYKEYPKHPQAGEARSLEYELVSTAVKMGDTNKLARLELLAKERLADTFLSDDERFKLMAEKLERVALSHREEGMAVMLTEYEKGVRALIKQFPKRPEVYEMLYDIASNSDGEKAVKIARELADSPASKEVKEGAQVLLRKLEAIGKPLPIKFTSLNGAEVDLSKMKGKVVLVDFWATWCGPCVAELPNVKAAYEKYHEQGFEIVGISFDEQREKLKDFVAKEKMPWPQYFDGKGWENKFGQEYGITSIPAMWLVDKKGNLRDLDARPELREKVQKLLAEP